MVGITAACTCTVDGVSGSADTRYNGYSFTGCGAHVDYKYQLQGAGYDTTWCYVTSPPDCPGESPYVPEGFKVDNTLPEWEEAGAAWKECYDGYRCEAWWGSLSGSPEGEPVVLDAPLDWPDCCALCSNMTGDAGDTAACAAWSFDPSSGSCQLMATVDSTSKSPNEWGVSNTIHGYPGYFEAPASGCWSRGEFDLCVNMNMGLLIPGVLLAFFSLCCIWRSGLCSPLENSSVLREILLDSRSYRLVKASCLEVTVTRTATRTRKGGTSLRYDYEGTFETRDGALFMVPPKVSSYFMYHGRAPETQMLRVLFAKALQPQVDPAVAERCKTPRGLKSEFQSLVRSVKRNPTDRTTETVSRQEEVPPRFDCLLLVGRNTENGENSSAPKVLLVGILGESRLICTDAETLQDSTGVYMSFRVLSMAAALLVVMCVALLTSEAAQIMATWTFEGTNYRVGAVTGLVLCASIPTVLYGWIRYKYTFFARLAARFPPVDETLSPLSQA